MRSANDYACYGETEIISGISVSLRNFRVISGNSVNTGINGIAEDFRYIYGLSEHVTLR